MKSAVELALERLEKESPSVKLTDAQRAEIAEIDSASKAKLAEKRVFLGAEIAKARAAGDVLAVEELEDQLRREVRRIEEQAEADKEKVRARST